MVKERRYASCSALLFLSDKVTFTRYRSDLLFQIISAQPHTPLVQDAIQDYHLLRSPLTLYFWRIPRTLPPRKALHPPNPPVAMSVHQPSILYPPTNHTIGLPGAITCSSTGLITYCANPGYKCCDAQYSAPVTATCCPGNTFARQGRYCCREGGSCANGQTCLDCTPVSGTNGVPGVSSVAVPSLPATTMAPVPTSRVVPVFTYYTFTIT